MIKLFPIFYIYFFVIFSVFLASILVFSTFLDFLFSFTTPIDKFQFLDYSDNYELEKKGNFLRGN